MHSIVIAVLNSSSSITSYNTTREQIYGVSYTTSYTAAVQHVQLRSTAAGTSYIQFCVDPPLQKERQLLLYDTRSDEHNEGVILHNNFCISTYLLYQIQAAPDNPQTAHSSRSSPEVTKRRSTQQTGQFRGSSCCVTHGAHHVILLQPYTG